MKIFEVWLYSDGSIEQIWEDSLSSAGIVDYLSGKEELLIVFSEGVFFLDIFGPFEEEYESIDVWLYAIDEIVIFERVDLFYLDSRSSHTFD